MADSDGRGGLHSQCGGLFPLSVNSTPCSHMGSPTHRSHNDGRGSVSERCRTWANGGEFGDNNGGLVRFFHGGSRFLGLRRGTRLRLLRSGGGGFGVLRFPSRGAGKEKGPGDNGETHGGGSFVGYSLCFKDPLWVR